MGAPTPKIQIQKIAFPLVFRWVLRNNVIKSTVCGFDKC